MTEYFVAVPLAPSGFVIFDETYTVADVMIQFKWDEPQGSGPEGEVDFYTIIITPTPLSPLSSVSALPGDFMDFNVTLNYNTTYTAAITAGNCAGMGETFVYPVGIEYGKCIQKWSS